MTHDAKPPRPLVAGPAAAGTLPPIDRATAKNVQTAVFALGCFWGVEALYSTQPGVVRVRCGYCGGTAPNPTYHDLKGYTEAVAVDFDPTQISYEKLLNLFWSRCSPTQKSWSVQYKSAVFYDGPEQEKSALASKAALARQLGAQIPIDVIPATHFYTAEDYHQHYRLRNTRELMREFSGFYPDSQDFLNSTAAARVNGYLSGFGTPAQLAAEIDTLGLSPQGQKRLTDIVASQPTESCGL